MSKARFMLKAIWLCWHPQGLPHLHAQGTTRCTSRELALHRGNHALDQGATPLEHGCPFNGDLRHQIFSHLFQCCTHSTLAQRMPESLYSIVMKRLNMYLVVPVGALVWT